MSLERRAPEEARDGARRRMRSDAGARRAARRMELLDAADSVIRRDGPAASMDVIAAEAGITKPILYRHFGDKGGLYTALAHRYANALMSEIKDSLERATEAKKRLALTIDTYFAFLESEPQVYRFLVHRAQAERREVHDAIGAFVRDVALEVAAVARRNLLADNKGAAFAEPLAFAVVGAVQMAGDWWLEHREVSRARLVEELVTLVWDGFERYATEGVAG
ncbi:MAG: TetR family transcriptional regulator [Actinomycetota bacterium]